jgi:hypothetical protein
MVFIFGKYNSGFPEQNEIINKILDIIKGNTKSPLTVFGQLEELALEKMNRDDETISF